MTPREAFVRWTPPAVTAVVIAIGLYDAAMGLFLLRADAPWTAHGPGTVWDGVAHDVATESLFRRMGAFSLHAGVVTVVWAWLARRDAALRTALLVTYLVTGLGFYWTDATFFDGTPYRSVKLAIGDAFAAALVAHLGWLWLTRKRAVTGLGAPSG